ncbi:MAG TPA: gamma-glutamylcyclotransferase family protein [Methylomirabilota bacterium]|nr:gamma-glutamylcyclotransferase family protein [Methylomirabilota bacterium]
MLFAYGTLMRGYPLHAVMAGRVTLLAPGTARGRLLDLGRYPGLVGGAGRVSGEVYRLDDPELLPVLDREEGYNFDRRRAIVTLAGGRRVRAWLYRYRGPRERATPIPDGDYRRARPPAARPATQSSPGRHPWR